MWCLISPSWLQQRTSYTIIIASLVQTTDPSGHKSFRECNKSQEHKQQHLHWNTSSVAPEHDVCVNTSLCVLTAPGRTLFPKRANFLLKPFEWWVSGDWRQWVLQLNYEAYEVILHYFHFEPATQQFHGVPHNIAVRGSANKLSPSYRSYWCLGAVACLISAGWDAITYS